MPFTFTQLEIPGLVLVEPQRLGDERGFFMELFKASEFADQGLPPAFVQDNLSHSTRGVLRGLHYQVQPRAQGKLLTALSGRIFDVAADIRHGSPTYGRWLGVELTAENGIMFYVPPGFAHGYCVLSHSATLLYKVTDEYAPECERGIIWNDPQIGVEWPITEPLLSPRDADLPPLHEAENSFSF
ncbi:MAG: dTDP-4-dehydrorhamnose 3,5-epimerase [Anaerolineae bacterium]|jgi:dTDP-4-dehydrorhamnose 3,5-epimerase